jgi:hypothetical protein
MRDATGESTNAAGQPNFSGSPYPQRDVLRQAGTYLIGIAAKGIKFTDPSAAILTGSSPLTGSWPG